MIEFVDVSFSYLRPKRYRDLIIPPFRRERSIALEHVNLVVHEGERLAILGANGAGKTTLLKLMGGLLYPTLGNVRLDAHDSVRHNSALRSRIGYVINEERSFYWRLTGLQNLEFFGALDNLRGPALRRRARELLESVGLAQHADKPVSNYSSGMRQRLAIARGLLPRPDTLLLDEPTRSLDPVGADRIRQLILEATRTDGVKTLAVTTNHLDDVAAFCTRFCMIKAHRLTTLDVWRGDARAVRHLYEPSDAPAQY